MKIEIYYSLSERHIETLTVDIPEGMLLGEAIPASLAEQMLAEGLSPAVWGRSVKMDDALQAGDRVELVRGLRVDPMTARRERFNQQGIKKAGLFKTKRAGAKAGY
ncbi:MAG: RnfH family protein [Cytophagales bacterium]|nr:RnfH family protein [Cytophagales bacterium]